MKSTKQQITEYMKLHNADKVGIDNQWTLEDAEYFLQFEDEFYYNLPV